MTDQDFLRKVHSEVYFLGTCVILQLATDRQEAGIVAADDLVLDEPLLEGVAFLEGAVFFSEHAQQVIVDLLAGSSYLHLVIIIGDELELRFKCGGKLGKNEGLVGRCGSASN